MKAMKHEAITKLINQWSELSADGDTPEWRKFHEEHSGVRVELRLPISHALNPELAGHLWVAKFMGCISGPHKITDERITMQGLEQMLFIQCDLLAALDMAGAIGKYQCEIRLATAENG